MSDAASKLAYVRGQIDNACKQVQRHPAEVTLLAVSKTHPAQRIREFYALGLNAFGENYAQEMASKAAELQELPIRFVYIGRLQSNKIKLIVETACEIQTVASESHARLIARYAKESGKRPYPIYICVNAGDEAQKSGLSLASAKPLAALITSTMPELVLLGLMAIPPPLSEPDRQGKEPPELYRELARLAKTIGHGQLSLGMSNDLAPAIAAGSTCVRIGTTLFGPRPLA